MNYYRIQAGLPATFADQPRTGPKRYRGKGWRESNCQNDVVSTTRCCVGYWQIHTGNLRGTQYEPYFKAHCGVYVRADVMGNHPLQKQKQACAAKVILDISGEGNWDNYL